MYYYILDESNVIVNSIVVADGDDPAKYGAIADERPFNLGDTWSPAPEPEPEPTLEDRVASIESAIERGLSL